MVWGEIPFWTNDGLQLYCRQNGFLCFWRLCQRTINRIDSASWGKFGNATNEGSRLVKFSGSAGVKVMYSLNPAFSDHARTCPHCGAPVIATIKRRQRAALIDLGILNVHRHPQD